MLFSQPRDLLGNVLETLWLSRYFENRENWLQVYMVFRVVKELYREKNFVTIWLKVTVVHYRNFNGTQLLHKNFPLCNIFHRFFYQKCNCRFFFSDRWAFYKISIKWLSTKLNTFYEYSWVWSTIVPFINWVVQCYMNSLNIKVFNFMIAPLIDSFIGIVMCTFLLNINPLLIQMPLQLVR